MSTTLQGSSEIANATDLQRVIAEIRDGAAGAHTREELTQFYRHVEALIALTYSPSWQRKFGDQVEKLRQTAMDEFSTTAHAINQRAEQIGTKADYDETWGGKERVYGEVNNDADLRKIFAAIRGDVETAATREDLTRLYRRAEYLLALTYAPAWHKKFGSGAEALRRTAAAEFTTTAHAINQRAAMVGVAADYDETWG
ncbi:MAG: hypothetical protein KC442_10530, partial [Thermomicrobiales bacterium]|nr:hypothetical protein [Thermomicrobiales bacterium]